MPKLKNMKANRSAGLSCKITVQKPIIIKVKFTINEASMKANISAGMGSMMAKRE
jgi:hypothetical protein